MDMVSDGVTKMRTLTSQDLDRLRDFFQNDAFPLTEDNFVRVWNNEIALGSEDTIFTWYELIEYAGQILSLDDIVDHFIYSACNGDIPQRGFDQYLYTFDAYQYPIQVKVTDVVDFDNDDYIKALYDYYNDTCDLDSVLDQTKKGGEN